MDHENTNKIDSDAGSSNCDSEKKRGQSEEKDTNVNNTVKPGKKLKRGIIYLSTIPKFMNVTMIREIFSEYGQLGRVYLQLDENGLSIIFFFCKYW